MKKQATIINLTASITVNQPYIFVFEYLSNYTNDVYWRKEINNVTMDTDTVGKGTVITESSLLSAKVPDHTTTLQCIDFKPYLLIKSESTPAAAFWSANTRTVEALSSDITKVTYRLQFDMAVVKFGLGFSLPKFIVHIYTKQTMKKYLGVLKQLVEKENSAVKALAS